MDFENGYYLAKFYSDSDYHNVVSKGSWVLYNHYNASTSSSNTNNVSMDLTSLKDANTKDMNTHVTNTHNVNTNVTGIHVASMDGG